MNDKDDVDFMIFESEERCNKNNRNIDTCACLDRIMYSLKYFKALNAQSNQDLFVNFIQTIYRHYIDDIIHLSCAHGNDLEELHKLLFTKYEFKKCDISLCVLSDRHNTVNRKRNAVTADKMYIFYQTTFDALHYYLFHLFDLGLRCITNDGDVDNKQDDNISCFDAVFLRKQQFMYRKRKEFVSFFDRFKTVNNKFTLQTQANEDGDHERLFLDVLYHETFTHHYIHLKALHSYLLDEEFDTDALIQDIDQHSQQNTSNICKQINNEQLIEGVIAFVEHHRLKGSAFSTGFVFWYWPYYAKSNDTEESNKLKLSFGNENDYDGYSESDLYIKEGKWHNFKEEILDYYNITMDIYNDVIVLKVKQYINTQKVKKIRAKKESQWGVRHYDISVGTEFKEEHLTSLVLYCDFTELCTLFSATFRRLHPLETLKGVKERNKKYYFMSKFLRETVEIYGIDGIDRQNRDECEKGPFFSGMSRVMVMSSFSIRLNGPTSTTKQIDVSMNFAQNDGIIIQLNNQSGDMGRFQRFFDSSWLSAFKEEDERIFIGGCYAMQIQSIRITKTHQNFEVFFKVLFVFDYILSGNVFGDMELKDIFTDQYMKVISSLVEYCEGIIDRQSIKYDSYIIDTFNMFRFNKKTFTVDIDMFYRFCPSLLQDLIFESLLQRKKNDDKDDIDNKSNANILRLRILNIFPNLQNIVVYASFCDPLNKECDEYPFSFYMLLELLRNLERVKKGNKIECKISCEWKQGNRSWLFDEYSSSPIQSELFSVTLSSYKDSWGDDCDLLSIKSS